MKTAVRFVLGAAAAALLLVAFAGDPLRRWAASEASPSPQEGSALEGEVRDPRVRNAGIAPGKADPAGTRGEWQIGDEDLGELRRVAATAVPLAELEAEQPLAWIPTRIGIEDIGDLDLYEDCRQAIGRPEGEKMTCEFELDLVLDADNGKIVYTRLLAAKAAEIGPTCVEFAECFAERKLGQEVPPPPPGTDGKLGIRHSVRAKPTPRPWQDPAHVDEIVAALRLDLAAAKADLGAEETTDPSLAFSYQRQERLVEYLVDRAARLRKQGS